MESPYINSENKYFYLHGIPFLPLNKRGKAVNCRIGNSRQLVFIPAFYFTRDLTLNKGLSLEWFYWKTQTQNKIKKYLDEVNNDRNN
jgi:hypothetical protein